MVNVLKRASGLIVFFLLATTACQKSETYEELSKIAHDKYLEIKALSESRSCTDLDEWQMKTIYYSCWYHFAIHQDDVEEFERLAEEYIVAQKRADEAGDRPILFYLSLCGPNPPAMMTCEAGKPKLVHAYEIDDLSVVESELASRYDEIMSFYAGVPCTDPEDWTSRIMRNGCCYEGVAVHKTIKTWEAIELLYIHGGLNAQKMRLIETECNYEACNYSIGSVQCRDGRPYVEMTD